MFSPGHLSGALALIGCPGVGAKQKIFWGGKF
jgi:hypothetical protein